MDDKVYQVTFKRVSYATVFVVADKYSDYGDYVQTAQSMVNNNDSNKIRWTEIDRPVVVHHGMVEG